MRARSVITESAIWIWLRWRSCGGFQAALPRRRISSFTILRGETPVALKLSVRSPTNPVSVRAVNVATPVVVVTLDPDSVPPPVATVAVGGAGARNAAYLAAAIIGLADADVRARYKQFRRDQSGGELE